MGDPLLRLSAGLHFFAPSRPTSRPARGLHREIAFYSPVSPKAIISRLEKWSSRPGNGNEEGGFYPIPTFMGGGGFRCINSFLKILNSFPLDFPPPGPPALGSVKRITWNFRFLIFSRSFLSELLEMHSGKLRRSRTDQVGAWLGR